MLGSGVTHSRNNDVVSIQANIDQLSPLRIQVRNPHNQHTANPNSTPEKGNIIMHWADVLQLKRPLTIAQDSSALFQAESGGMATIYPCTFPQFMPPASIDTVAQSISPQYFLPESISIETVVPDPDSTLTNLDVMVSLNFPRFSPYTSTNSLVGNDYSNCRTDTFCTVQTQHNINNLSLFGGIVETPTGV